MSFYTKAVFQQKSFIKEIVFLLVAYFFVLGNGAAPNQTNIHDCGHQTDYQCLEAKDDICGWCTLEKKCVPRDKCNKTMNDSSPWIHHNFRSKLNISKVSPEYLSRDDSNIIIQLTVDNLPLLGTGVHCEFTFAHRVMSTDGTQNGTVVNCPSPSADLLSSMTKTYLWALAKLTIHATNISNIISTVYLFYECNGYSSCVPCTVSKFKCYWSTKAHKCMRNTAESISEISTLEKYPAKVYDTRYCPFISLIAYNGSSEIFIPHGTRITEKIAFKIYNLHEFDSTSQFVCNFIIENENSISVSATVTSDMLFCSNSEDKFTYVSKKSKSLVWVKILERNSNSNFNKMEEMNLYVYKCKYLALNCSQCLNLDKKYKCGWCESTNQCEVETQCDTISARWLDQLDSCPNSSVLYFAPQLGLCEGGTNLIIRNIKQNFTFDDIKKAITVAGVPCEPIENLYVPNEKIVCQLNRNTNSLCVNIAGPIKLNFKNFLFVSKTNFTFVNPKIKDISPKEGPQKGGNELTITGEFMDAGTNIEVFIGELPCMLIAKKSTILKCVTIAATYSFKSNVIIKFDNGIRTSENFMYEYNDDLPYTSNYITIPKGIPGGGEIIRIDGLNLHSIYDVKIYVKLDLKLDTNPKLYHGNCTVASNSYMTCLSPSIPNVIDCSSDWKIPKLLPYGFHMEILNESLDYSIEKKYPRFVLYCRPIYNQTSSNDSGPWAMIISITGILFPLAVIIFLWFYHNTIKSYRKMKKMREDLDRLELFVAAECKEAFAELQTEISDSRISGMPDTLPFWDYHTYLMKILFPNMKDHSKILANKPEHATKKGELQMFFQLITNKTFLLIFIRTLESNSNFSLNDRVYFASMLMMTLQNEMEYCTDIIKTLLTLMVEKYVRNENNAKLLFRQTQSVVEKMLSAWFTFLLYKFLLECAGKPLFTLYKGMKQQISKGPVDVITSEARYSLCEDKLIRQHVDYCSLTVNVSVPEQTATATGLLEAVENVPVKMLDCDTISQAKEKAVNSIYYAVNFSKRPKPSELDFKFEADSSSSIILRDTDLSSQVEDEWRRCNTLSHYEIKDGFELTLVLAEKESTPILPATVRSNRYQLPESPDCDNWRATIIECATPKTCRARYISFLDNDAYYKEWHLVKPNQPKDDHVYHDGSNIVSEVYLTRLLTTKGTLQKFVDEVFEVILSKARQSDCFPIPIKYMFDFLDDQASQYGITDPEVVHTWKNNCLHLRFWVNLIKNPDFLFDVHKSEIVDSCLNVVAQAFMDSCYIGEHRLGKDSPTAKLLYAKDIPFYKERVKKYYSDIKAMPAVSRGAMNALLAKESQLHCMDFNVNSAVYEIYKYALKYRSQLMAALREDEFAQKYNLVSKMEVVLDIKATD